MNILKEMQLMPDHPFHSYFEINDEGTAIKQSGSNKWICIFGTDGKIYFEKLAQVIIYQSDYIKAKDEYTSEFIYSNGNRSDLVHRAPAGNVVGNIIEFKYLPHGSSEKLISDTITSAFDQVVNKYINSGDIEQENVTVSVALIDPEYLIRNPDCATTYLTMPEKDRAILGYEVFKSHGIYILADNYSVKNKTFLLHEKRPHKFPETFLLEEIETIIFGRHQSGFVVRLNSAINLPTDSSGDGIQNVRNIIDPDEKFGLVMDIFETSSGAYLYSSTSTLDAIERVKSAGAPKALILVRSMTFANNYNKYSLITSFNGSLADGQNSIDCYRIIKTVCINYLNGVEPSRYYEKELEKLIKQKFSSKRDVTLYIEFLNSCMFPVTITFANDTDEATSIAISKNNSINVSDNDKSIAAHLGIIKEMSHNLYCSKKVILDYPKRPNIGILKNTLINFRLTTVELSKYYHAYINSTKQTETDMLKVSTGIGNTPASTKIDNFIKAFSSVNDSDNSQYSSMRRSMNEQIASKKELLEVHREYNATGVQVEILEEEIKNLEKRVKSVTNNISNKHKTISNFTGMENLTISILRVKEIAKNHHKLRSKSSCDFLRQEGFTHLVFVAACEKFKKDIKHSIIATKKDLNEIAADVADALEWLSDECGSGITDIRNSPKGSITVRDGSNRAKSDVISEFYKKCLGNQLVISVDDDIL